MASAHRTWKRQPAKARPHGGTWLTQAILAGVPCLSQRADGALCSRMMTATQAFSRPWTSRRVYEWSPDERVLEYVCEEGETLSPPWWTDAKGTGR